ncbi:MAG: serine/threonine protein kinase [Deltaproteobacteria bacterium]|nr:serine/threonine protein kinase [Deltaproteobacteria bacterium]
MDPRRDSPKGGAEASAEDPSARVGSTIKEKWRVDALIGTGGMASVFSATHRNGQRVALKILHTVLAHDQAVKDRFLREGYVTNSVGHDACVAVLDDDLTEDGAPFLVMELLEGETLRDLWKKSGRKLPVVRSLQIVDPVIDCLAACHAAGVIHRDLKPPNIFLTHKGVVKVLDFGVAQLRSATAERTRAGTALGTPHYMSPEQAMGLTDQLDGRADLFSIGAILHALVTGHRIHTARTENEALILAATTPVPSIARLAPDLPVEVVKFIDKSLSWDRRNRHADAKEMLADLRKLVARLGGAGASVSRAAVAEGPSIEVEEGPEPTPAPEEEVEAEEMEELAGDDDPRVLKLQELFKALERFLPNVRTMGWEHPATQRAVRTVHGVFVDALKDDPNLVNVTCRPYSFLRFGQTIWEPGPPNDMIPYNLFECGIREIRFKPGVTLEEFKSTIELWTLDPGKDLAPEDDIVAAFWDRGLKHVEVEAIDVFAEGGAGERELFYSEAGELEKHAAESAMNAASVEVRAMAVSTDDAALKSQHGAGPMALDEVVRAAVSPRMVVPNEQWTERYVRALCDAIIDADEQQDLPTVMGSLGRSACDLIVAGRLTMVLAFCEALRKQVSDRVDAKQAARIGGLIDDALLGGEALALALDRLQSKPEGVTEFAPALMRLNPDHLPKVLGAYRSTSPMELRKVLLEYIERAMPVAKEEVGVSIQDLDPAVSAPVLALLKKVGTPATRKILSNLAKSKDPMIRIEAQVLSADTPDALAGELNRLCADPSQRTRIAVYRVLARHGLRAAVPNIVRQIKAPTFSTIEAEERKELFKAILSLSPERGEDMALELAKKGGLLTSENRETSRIAAIEALGEVCRSIKVSSQLREVAQSRWGTSEETRSKAAAAAGQIEQRVAAGNTAEGVA